MTISLQALFTSLITDDHRVIDVAIFDVPGA